MKRVIQVGVVILVVILASIFAFSLSYTAPACADEQQQQQTIVLQVLPPVGWTVDEWNSYVDQTPSEDVNPTTMAEYKAQETNVAAMSTEVCQ